jgi:hypothetical protein
MALGSGIRKKPIPDPGSRGQKGTGSRIPDPDPQHWLRPTNYNKQMSQTGDTGVNNTNICYKMLPRFPTCRLCPTSGQAELLAEEVVRIPTTAAPREFLASSLITSIPPPDTVVLQKLLPHVNSWQPASSPAYHHLRQSSYRSCMSHENSWQPASSPAYHHLIQSSYRSCVSHVNSWQPASSPAYHHLIQSSL